MFVNNFLHVYVAYDVGICKHDVVDFFLRHNVAFKTVNRVDLSLEYVAERVERKRRKQCKAAVFAV